jgi:hypothetical protein|tara:strand:+ start:598 stop:807 length:210 start_codon:yes stop_codon:yes gene_type:complete
MKKVDIVGRSIILFPEGFEIDGKKVELCISTEDIAALLAAYDPDDFNSPDIVTCRELSRLILDALNSDE